MMNSLEMAITENIKKFKILEQLLTFLFLIFHKIITFSKIKFLKEKKERCHKQTSK